jgi:TPR repeat protein
MLCGAAIFWWSYKENAEKAKLAQKVADSRSNAERGDAQAQHNLGNLYYHGEGITQDYGEAVRWYRVAAQQGYAKAEDALGYMYRYGHGVPQDNAEAVLWFRKAANQGDPGALVNLALSYYNGQGISQDYAQAASLYREAANQGSAEGEDGLGLMFYHGYGVPQDYTEAARWFGKAADQGMAAGQYDLGILYYYGRGVPQDRWEARRRFRQAAEQGDEHARTLLGMKLTPWLIFILAVQAMAGIALAFSPLSLNMWEQSEGIRSSRDWLSIGTGVLFLLVAGLSWYGYTHNLIWCLIYGFTGFEMLNWSLNAIALVLLYFVFFSKKSPIPESPQESTE